MTARAYRGRLLTAVTTGSSPPGAALRWLDDALLVVEGGRLARVDPWTEGAFAGAGHRPGLRADEPRSAPVPVRDLRPAVLVPGFVDTHVHYPQARVVGSAGAPLLEWLEGTVFPEEARFRDEAYARAVAAELTRRLAAAGTTTACLYSSSDERATHILFEALAASGLRAVAGLTLMDQRCPAPLCVPRAEAIAACERLASAWHGHDGGRLAFAITPRFALSCSRALMEDAARLAERRGLLVQTHLAETPAECAAVLAEHPIAADYLGVYERVGLIGPRTILAHAVHLSPAEWDRIAARGAAVAHCPDSNFFLGSGRMRLAEAEARGVRVGLGSDVAAGRSFDLRRAMAYAYDTALSVGHRVTAADLFALATIGGARALGLDARIGTLEPGKDADFLAIDLPDHGGGQAAALAHLAFSDEGRVTRAFVRGEPVLPARRR
jgi:guanine deaminase